MNEEYNYEKKFDVVIVGAGVIGCSIAYYLNRLSGGKLKVGIIERNNIGAETSGGAAGMLAAQIESLTKGSFFDFAIASRALFPQLSIELKDLTGIDIDYMESGILEVAY